MHKPIFYTIVLLFQYHLQCSENIPSTIIQSIQNAQDMYKQKNYTKAIELYQQVINDNYISFELYYNLGNAYYKNNQLGKAILYYEKAKKLNPSDDDLNHNLKIAYAQTIDKIETKDNFFIEVTKNNFLNHINPDYLAYVSIGLSLLALFSFALFLFYHHYRKMALIIFILSTIGVGTSYLLGHIAITSQHTQHFAVVTQKEIKVTNEPLPNAIAKFKLHEGTKLKILQKVDEYYLIRLENGAEGWIEQNAVEII